MSIVDKKMEEIDNTILKYKEIYGRSPRLIILSTEARTALLQWLESSHVPSPTGEIGVLSGVPVVNLEDVVIIE